jgi:hypothetical protein
MLLPYVHMESSINSNAWFCIPCLWKDISAVVHQAPAIHIKSYNNGFLFVQKPISAAHRFPHLMESNLPWLTCWNPNYIGEQVEKWWFQSEILRASATYYAWNTRKHVEASKTSSSCDLGTWWALHIAWWWNLLMDVVASLLHRSESNRLMSFSLCLLDVFANDSSECNDPADW